MLTSTFATLDGSKVKARRVACGLTQRDLATSTRISLTTLRDIEQELETDSRVSTAWALADAFDCAVEELLRIPGRE